MSYLLWTLVIGIVVGGIAKLLMPGRDPGGCVVTFALGVAGSFLGTFVGRMLGLYKQGQTAGFIMAVLGAMLLLGIYRLAVRRR